MPLLHLVTRNAFVNSVLDTLVNPIFAKIAGSLSLESVRHCLEALIRSRSIVDPCDPSSRVSHSGWVISPALDSY